MVRAARIVGGTTENRISAIIESVYIYIHKYMMNAVLLHIESAFEFSHLMAMALTAASVFWARSKNERHILICEFSVR